MIKFAPLDNGFFLVSIIGFFISVFAIYPKSPTWGFTLGLLSVLMFISSMISMTYSSVDDFLMKEDKKRNALRNKRGENSK